MKLSDIFKDSDPKHLSTSEAKNAAFQIFKEVIWIMFLKLMEVWSIIFKNFF